jgi:hypothetical protein
MLKLDLHSCSFLGGSTKKLKSSVIQKRSTHVCFRKIITKLHGLSSLSYSIFQCVQKFNPNVEQNSDAPAIFHLANSDFNSDLAPNGNWDVLANNFLDSVINFCTILKPHAPRFEHFAQILVFKGKILKPHVPRFEHFAQILVFKEFSRVLRDSLFHDFSIFFSKNATT